MSFIIVGRKTGREEKAMLQKKYIAFYVRS